MPHHTELALPLPEELRKLKDAGRLTETRTALAAWLERDLPEALRRRLLLEQERLSRYERDYPIHESDALEEMQKYFPEMTEEQFKALEAKGKIDFIFLEGEKRYFIRFARTLFKDSLMRQAFGLPVTPDNPYLDDMIQKIRDRGSLAVRFTLESSLTPKEKGFLPGVWRGWLPYPALCAQQSEMELLSKENPPTQISGERSEARTAYFERALTKPETFSVRYAYVSKILYADPLNAPAPAEPLYPHALPVCDADLQEDGCQIQFTPYLRALAQEIAGDARTPLEKAWKSYRFVTTRVSYSFMPDYLLLDNVCEFPAVNLRGDCGLQALLFVILCRILGVPARWQSGLCIDEDDVGSHDWAQFFLPGWGWLFADCSYGGSAWRAGSPSRHAFYFGNLDVARMVANRVFTGDFTPAGNLLRRDPYDSQTGEMERRGDEHPLPPDAYERHVTLLSREELLS